jgi:hypothetical protein
MSGDDRDYDCRCDPPVVNRGPADTAAAYCWGCLGWTRRPTKAGTISELQRRFFLRFRGTRTANLNPLTREAMEEALAQAEAETEPRMVKEHRGRKRLKDGCSKGHASWAWRKTKTGRYKCDLCAREYNRRGRRNVCRPAIDKIPSAPVGAQGVPGVEMGSPVSRTENGELVASVVRNPRAGNEAPP